LILQGLLLFPERKKKLIKLPEPQKQDNNIDCGLFSLANAVEFCQSGFKGGTRIKFEQKYMRGHLVLTFFKSEVLVDV
jgi:hypothetical protein